MATQEEYVRPVPEEEWMQELKERGEAAPEAAAAETKATPPADVPKDDRTGRRRRRRPRAAGRPTRLIGTGRKDDDD